jgi:hypothetical protein
MILTRLLGALTLATGGSLLLSELLLGQDLFREVTGTTLAPLRLGCVMAIVLGALAVKWGRRDEHETQVSKEGPEG